jgi:beta-glucosidase
MELLSGAESVYRGGMPRGATNGSLLQFPPGFLWGTATAPTQIEGHIQNEWTDFVASDGRTCHPACDSYHRYAEDVEWMRRLGVNAYRMGIEWSRLQPGPFAPLADAELARYCDQLDRLIAAGIEPMVVLHHFSNPRWINDSGAWVNPATIVAFLDYAGKLVRALRSRIRIWNTFNEPDTYACCGYLIGQFPPLRHARLHAYHRVIRHMAEAHRQVCRLIRQTGSERGPVEVGFSKNWTWFEPYGPRSPWDAAMAGLAHRFFNRFVLRSFVEGDGRESATFLGVNYYGRIRFRNLRPLVPMYGLDRMTLARLGVICDDMLERHPAGLESALKKMREGCGLPIYLTEHGCASGDESFREQDLRENLSALHRAITSGVDVRGFFYWSLLDNFEWQFGYEKKFGLIGVDFEDAGLARSMKPLGQVYRAVCLANGVQG